MELGLPHIIREFEDMFPKELPGLPPHRELDFTIELQPGTAPISMAPFRMALADLKELKIQLQELLDKGSSGQAHHHGEHLLRLSKRKKELYGCVLTTDNSIRQQSRIIIHCLGLTTCSIN